MIISKVDATRRASYEIRIEEPLLDHSNPALANEGDPLGRRLVVVDKGLPSDFWPRTHSYFAAFGIQSEPVFLEGGEQCKSLKVVEQLVCAFDAFGLNRSGEPVIIIGGGAVLDVAGFAASVYRRGVPFVRIPTTLLAYVDASVGVKTGINYAEGKNLIGSFAVPHVVFLDRNFLDTLSLAEVVSGLGEIVKLAVACDARLFESLENATQQLCSLELDDPEVLKILKLSIRIMVEELEPNLFETCLARVVDFGHTFSQRLELGHSVNGSGIRHGEAVALDICLSVLISMHREMLSASDVHRLFKLIQILGLPTEMPDVSSEAIWDSVTERTRHRGGSQRIPIPVAFGSCIFINDLRQDEVELAMNEFPKVMSSVSF